MKSLSDCRWALVLLGALAACSKPSSSDEVAPVPPSPVSPAPAVASPDESPGAAPSQTNPLTDAWSSSPVASAQPSSCGGGGKLVVHFYNVSQGLAALVDLPDGRHVLVDTGDSVPRAGCGDVCAAADAHLLERLGVDLHGAPIDLLWVTHQHSDHIGGAPRVMDAFKVLTYVDNGRDERKAEVRRAHQAAERHGTIVHVVDPDRPEAPIAGSGSTKLTPVIPSEWPASCAHDANDCSIALRIDFCASSVLFTGDAPHDEEPLLDPHGRVTLLQVGHHGSETSTTPGFLEKLHPSYAVISAGKPGEGMNSEYCHPRAIIVKRLTALLGGPGSRTIRSFDGDRCSRAQPSDWIDVEASDRLWATERDGDVVLSTTGDGVFSRQ